MSEAVVRRRLGLTGSRVFVRGILDSTNLDLVLQQVRFIVGKEGPVFLDLGELAYLDHRSASRLHEELTRWHEAGRKIQVANAHGQPRAILEKQGTPAIATFVTRAIPGESLLDRLGNLLVTKATEVWERLCLFGALLVAIGLMFYYPPVDLVSRLRGKRPPKRAVKWKDTLEQITLIGFNAIPVAGTILFLMGVVMAFQALRTLEKFNVEVFVADGVGISLVREIGALMTAIVVAGRSGSAITAEIGAMKVQDEIKAMETMGLDPNRYVLAPRALAMIIALPVLTAVTILIGIGGGLLAAVIRGINVDAYMDRTLHAITLQDIFEGQVKAVAYGVLIGLVACYQGKKVRGGAAAIGEATTRSVVECIFMIIVAAATLSTTFMYLRG